jgi:hypothetical protein
MAKENQIMNRLLIGTSIVAVLFSAPLYAVEKSPCTLPGWNKNKPVKAPSLKPGAQWIYTIGKDYPLTSLQFSAQQKNENLYEINGEAPWREIANTYTEANSGRSGEKITIRFPIKVGDTWEDKFSEPGSFADEYEEYRYDYTEQSQNRVAAVETIEIAAGQFKTLRIDRIAYWVKSNPQSIRASTPRTQTAPSAAEVRVEGITLTQLWYAPDLGRAVLKAQLRVGDALYAGNKDNLLKYANSEITELREYRQGSVVCAGKPELKAHWPESYFPIGYDLSSSNDWEYAFKMRPHRPLNR